MARAGYTEFKHSKINIGMSPVHGREFVRIMAMMAVPPDGKIYDVWPTNGMLPMLYNKHDAIAPCIGYLDIKNSIIDDDALVIKIAISRMNTLSRIEENSHIGIYVGGISIKGRYKRGAVGPYSGDMIAIGLDSTTYGAYQSLLSMQDRLVDIPVWILRTYTPPSGTPVIKAVVMDYYLDWSGGTTTIPVPSTELFPFMPEETTCRKYAVQEERCQWLKLCNVTGMSINMDTANSKMNMTLSTGIITAGKPSSLEPNYWLLDLDNGVYMRVYLNIQEIKYKMLGEYYVNKGQLHDSIYFRDAGVIGELSISQAVTEYTITTKTASLEFWSILETLSTAEGVKFSGRLTSAFGINDVPCEITYAANVWTAKFDNDVTMGGSAEDNIWGDITITGMYISRTVGCTKNEDGKTSTIKFTGDTGKYFNHMDTYEIQAEGSSYSLWWDTNNQEWKTNYYADELLLLIETLIRGMSYDSRDFMLEDIFVTDDTIHPNNVYYFRLKCTWQDMICRISGGESWIKSANIYTSDNEDKIPSRYGTYALSNYRVDNYGEQTRNIEHDYDGSTRYCGVYGRNHLCRLPDLYSEGMSMYPGASKFCAYYPPHIDRVLLSRAETGLQNNIGIQVKTNSISFDLSTQGLGDAKAMLTYAAGALQITDGASILNIKYRYAGHAGNGIVVNIVKAGIHENVQIHPAANRVITIYAREEASVTLYDIHRAIINPSEGPQDIISTLTGSGKEEGDVVAGGESVMLSGGGEEMVVTNNPGYRRIEDICRHPGYMLNGSRRQSPISMVGIYASYLSANYDIGSLYMDVIPVDTEEGIDLYLAAYMGDNAERYIMHENISPTQTLYEDENIVASYATCILPSPEGSVVLYAKTAGADGNNIMFLCDFVQKQDWENEPYSFTDNVDYVLEEDEANKELTLFVQMNEHGDPSGVLTYSMLDQMIDALPATLISIKANGDYRIDVTADYDPRFRGGWGTPSADNQYYIHRNGFIVGLKSTEIPNQYYVIRNTDVKQNWLFKDDAADLLLYKLENIPLGETAEELRTVEADKIWWKIKPYDFATIQERIEQRKALGILNYITIGGREVAIKEFISDGDTQEYQVHVDEYADRAISKEIRENSQTIFSINDIFYPAGIQSKSITKEMIYYGKFQPKITVQIPDMGEWGKSLVPYYIVRLEYSVNQG